MYGLTTAKNRNAKFKVAGASEHIVDTFRKIKIDSILDIHSSVDDALAK
jgi:hypothetical protein